MLLVLIVVLRPGTYERIVQTPQGSPQFLRDTKGKFARTVAIAPRLYSKSICIKVVFPSEIFCSLHTWGLEGA